MLNLIKQNAFIILPFVIVYSLSAATAAQDDVGSDPELVKKASQVIGYNIARNMVLQGIEIDREAFFSGIQKGFENAAFEMSEEDVESLMMAFQKYSEKRQIEKMKRAAESNKAEGEAFLAKNGSREGVKKLENGVQYEVLKEGTGENPKAEDKVSIHYHGTFLNGEVFDSSVNRKTPAELKVNQFVEGFASALQAMKVGEKWKVVIPSDRAYGVEGRPPIGPNQTLIFEIELLDILK